MIRKFRWPLIAFAVACGAFYLATRDDAPVVPAAKDAGLSVPALPNSSQPLAVIRSGDIPIAGGNRPYFRVLDPNTGRVKYEFRAERWEPVNESTFEMVRPDIRIHTPAGQITYVSAAGGRLELEGDDPRHVSPRRGRLQGDVNVIIDRTSRRWREARPALAERDAHPEQLVHISLSDEARFDMETSRLTADGAIRVRSVEADVDANAGKDSLEVRWNQIDNKLEFLALNHGGRMELRRGARIVDFAMPGTERDDTAASEAAAATPSEHATQAGGAAPPAKRAPDAAAASQPAAGDDDVDLAALADSMKRGGGAAASQPASQPVKRVESYAAEFDREVQVEQMDGTKTAGRLDCDRLSLIFDVGDELKQRTGLDGKESASQPAASTQGADRRDDIRSAAKASSAPAGDVASDRARLVLSWKGPMSLRPQDAEGPPTGRRFDAVATGRRVLVRDTRGSAECQKMVYRHEDRAVTFDGTPTAPARLLADDGREMSAPRIDLNRATGRGQLTGPGRLRDPGRESAAGGVAGALRSGIGLSESKSGSDAFDIRWQTDVEIELARLQRDEIDPETGRQRRRVADVLRRARFRGDVAMTQGERSLLGQDVMLIFGEPRRRGALADHITRAELTGKVKLTERDQAIAADRMKVDLALTATGRNLPTRAVGDGAVTITEPRRLFRADHLDARFATHTEANAAGVSVERAVLAKADAEGHVFARDIDDELEIEAQSLDAAFNPDGRLASARLLGTEPEPAHARRGDYAASGREIRVQADAQSLLVPGVGRAGLVTDTDFDGRRLADPVAVDISFTDGMSLDGRGNLIGFHGRVHAQSETHNLQCNKRLSIRLADIPPPPGAAIASSASRPFGGVAVAGLGPSARPQSSATGAATLVQWFKGRFITRRGAEGASLRIRKRPVFLLAEGEAVALTTEFDPQNNVRSRARIEGPAIEVDLRGERLNVPGRGSLFIEDYRARPGRGLSSKKTASAPPPGMFSGAGGPSLSPGEGPSVTLFNWANAMSFDMREALVRFDRVVQMNHLGGGKLLMLADKLDAIAADVESLRLSPGREATLNCDNLIVQFAAQPRSAGTAGSDRQARAFDIRWSELKRLIASGNIYMKDGDRSLIGHELSLDMIGNVLTLRGGPNTAATLSEEAEATQNRRSWSGSMITWNRNTGDVRADRPTVTSR